MEAENNQHDITKPNQQNTITNVIILRETRKE